MGSIRFQTNQMDEVWRNVFGPTRIDLARGQFANFPSLLVHVNTEEGINQRVSLNLRDFPLLELDIEMNGVWLARIGEAVSLRQSVHAFRLGDSTERGKDLSPPSITRPTKASNPLFLCFWNNVHIVGFKVQDTSEFVWISALSHAGKHYG